ncbi:MAG TPA: tetratricopeptide repeat protein, partial [Candidatus Polarisedimenticolaceae bacterium]|nr:tetratricopeptide repeat protein [Candidatus Polarisedimenticolaceae bacterium]
MILATLACAVAVAAAGATPGKEALDYGFRFASSLDRDLKDKAKAQQEVVLEYPAIGLLDEAVRRAEHVEGWRRGAVYADLATLLGQQGRKDDARALMARAAEVRQATTGWEGPRISAHLAQSHASLGEVEASERLAGDLARNDSRQYEGRSTATAAAAHAAHGEFAQAMALLAPLDAQADFEV